MANLFRGTCGAYTPIELYLLDALDSLDEDHPILNRFRDRGLIVNFDERAALASLARLACGAPDVALTICPTMGCNFDCPYCFENHRPGRMSPETQENIVALAGRLLKAAGGKALRVAWFGGEPLMMPDIIEKLSGRLMALAAAQGATYSASIITNGYLLTQDVADMLERCRVQHAQITLDGIGPAHDKTRHLAGGGPTFEHIVKNLRTLRLPFSVSLRHNIYAGNRSQVTPLAKLAEQLAAQSGNRIACHTAIVHESNAATARNAQVRLLCGEEADELELSSQADGFHTGSGIYCGAQRLYAVGVDDKGRLYKCWEDVDKPERSFGAAQRWDPADPIATADTPDLLIRYLNTALPTDDPECQDCPFLPQCAGGCPNRRLDYVELSVTGRCNLNCKHCFNAADCNPRTVEPTLDQLLALIERMAECGVCRLRLDDGEPLMRRDILTITGELARRDIALHELITNGTLVTPALLDGLEAQGHRPIWFVSFDGLGCHDWLRGVEGTEARVLKNIKLLCERGYFVHVHQCVWRDSLSSVKPTVLRMRDLGVSRYRVTPVEPSVRWRATAPTQSLSTETWQAFIPDFLDW